MVAGAAADVAFELLADGAVVEIVALAAHHVDRGHDHARRAVAALQAVIFAERFLHRMQRPVRRRQTLDGEHIGAFELQRQHGAGLDRLAVDVNDAGAALRGVAADMGAGQPQVFAQQLHQQRARIDIGGDGLAVHRQGNGCQVGCHRDSSSKIPVKRLELHIGAGPPAASRGEIVAILPIFEPWNKNYSEPRPRPRSREFQARKTPSRSRSRRRASRARRIDRGGKILKKIVGNLLGGAVDQALAELSEFAADLRLDLVAQRVPPSFGTSLTVAPPLAKPATPPSPWPEIL